MNSPTKFLYLDSIFSILEWAVFFCTLLLISIIEKTNTSAIHTIKFP